MNTWKPFSILIWTLKLDRAILMVAHARRYNICDCLWSQQHFIAQFISSLQACFFEISIFLRLQKCCVVDAKCAGFHLFGCLGSTGANGQSVPQYKQFRLKSKGGESDRLLLFAAGKFFSNDFVEQYLLTRDQFTFCWYETLFNDAHNPS